jgi:hypothetical protein
VTPQVHRTLRSTTMYILPETIPRVRIVKRIEPYCILQKVRKLNTQCLSLNR